MRRSIPLAMLLVAAPVLGVWAQANFDEPPEREPAPVMSYHGAAWLERPERDDEEKPWEVIEAIGLENGDVVADIGCGSGYFTRKFAETVAPDGKVYAVDIQPEFVEMVKENAAELELTNVEVILGDADDPKLPAKSIDWMFMSDVYHEFQEPEAMLARMREALKDDGKVCLLEYRLLGDTAAHIKRDHRMSVRQVLAEWNPAGFELIDLQEWLPHQHMFVFQKRPDFDPSKR